MLFIFGSYTEQLRAPLSFILFGLIVFLFACFNIMAPIAYTPSEPLPPSPLEHQIPTYDYRDSMRSWDIVTQSICITISTICILLRLYSKIYIVRNPGWEDCEFCHHSSEYGACPAEPVLFFFFFFLLI